MQTATEIKVTVGYVGHDAWHHKFEPSTHVHTVKVDAMTEGFGLERSAADKYALQEDGADIPEDKAIGDFHKEHLKVELVLKKEPHKGV